MQKQKQTKALAKKLSPAAPTLKEAYRKAAESGAPHEPEVMPAGSPAALAAASRERSDGILVQVRQDIDNAELGRFFELRAGVGLIVVKELCAHGEFMPEALRMIPGRHPRTLQRYIAGARQFLDAKALMAHEVWLPLSQVGQRSGRLLGPGGDGDALPQPAADAAEWLAEKDAEKKPKAEDDGGKRGPTVAERRLAAAGRWQNLAGQVADHGIARPDWRLLDTETLETVASNLRAVADQMLTFIKNAGKAAGKASRNNNA
jgi:hypothetical protein